MLNLQPRLPNLHSTCAHTRMLRAVPYQFLSLRRLPQPRIVRHADSAFSLPSLASSSRSATPQLPDPVPLITISKEEGFRLPPLQQSIEDEGKDDHWQRARGGARRRGRRLLGRCGRRPSAHPTLSLALALALALTLALTLTRLPQAHLTLTLTLAPTLTL